jgi:hypothetical protein
MVPFLSVSRSGGVPGYEPLRNPFAIVFVADNLSATVTLIGASQSLRSTMGRMIGMRLAIDWGTSWVAPLNFPETSSTDDCSTSLS